jgi:hypothetical protein
MAVRDPNGPGEPREAGLPEPPGEPVDLDRDVDPAHPYRARQLAPYRRDAGLYDSGLTGRYPGLRGSGSRDARIRSSGPGPGGDANPSGPRCWPAGPRWSPPSWSASCGG